MADANLVVGNRVEVVGKGLIGTVAFVGPTEFASGKWIGLILDDRKGKNNGSVQGKPYFVCEEEYGLFVRQTQVSLLDKTRSTTASPSTSSLTPEDVKSGSKNKSRLPTLGPPPPSASSISCDFVPPAVAASLPNRHSPKAKFYGETSISSKPNQKSVGFTYSNANAHSYSFSQKVEMQASASAQPSVCCDQKEKSPTKWYNQFRSKKSSFSVSSAVPTSKDATGSFFKRSKEDLNTSPEKHMHENDQHSSPRNAYGSRSRESLMMLQRPCTTAAAKSSNFSPHHSTVVSPGETSDSSHKLELKTPKKSAGRLNKLTNKLTSPRFKLGNMTLSHFGSRASPGKAKLPKEASTTGEKPPTKLFMNDEKEFYEKKFFATTADSSQKPFYSETSSGISSWGSIENSVQTRVEDFDFKPKRSNLSNESSSEETKRHTISLEDKIESAAAPSSLSVVDEEFISATVFMERLHSRTTVGSESADVFNKKQERRASTISTSSNFTPLKPPRPSLSRPGIPRRRSSTVSISKSDESCTKITRKSGSPKRKPTVVLQQLKTSPVSPSVSVASLRRSYSRQRLFNYSVASAFSATSSSAKKGRGSLPCAESPTFDRNAQVYSECAGSLRLPVIGRADNSKDGKSLQTTPSGSRSNLSTPSAKFDIGPSKRSSFVETGFASEREIVPQYTPGTPASLLTTPVSTPMMHGNDDRFTAIQANEGLRAEVKDLNEKLDTLKAKRAADQEKLREQDRLRLEVETLNEFRTKVLESQAALQRDLKKAKNDAREAIEAKERHAEEMADFSEAVEMATLDKEMAEEKSETLQLELEHSKEQIESLSSELKALKDEMSGKVNLESGEATSFQAKQVQAENVRLKDALVKFRDASAHDKHQHQKTLKDAETMKSEVKELTRSKERLEARVQELEELISDLQEQTEAALGAEEMVENLTEKNLNLEEKVSQLTEAVGELEALQDVNDQLEESAKELEMELRDKLQQALILHQNTLREQDALKETITDKNSTIIKFREVVQKLTDENLLLRRNLEEESSKSIPGLAEALDFKKMFAETKAQTTAIDLELRRIEAKEASLHVLYLSGFMPDGFMKRGGDNDALLVLLMVPRMIYKVELLLSQVREKLTPPGFEEGIPNVEGMATSPEVERLAFSTQLCFLLYTLLSELHRWSSALNACSADNFLKIGVLYADLAIQEKAVDFFLELLRKSQLDENIPTEGLEKCIVSFQNYYSVHLIEEQIEASVLVSDMCLASATASDCVITDATRLIGMLKQKNEKDSNVTSLLQDIQTIGESLRQLAKRTRRCLPDPPKQPPVSNKLQSQLLNDTVTLTKVVKILQEACKQAVRHIGMSGTDGLSSSKIEEFLQAAMEKCDSHVEGAGGIKEVMKEWLTTALMTMTDLAQVVNEAPVMPKDKSPTPLSVRAQTVKAEMDQTRNLKIQLEDKEVRIKELLKLLKSKQEELSEASIRKELAEKKLSNATKDSEMTVEKLTRKLEDLQSILQRKEREFQATLDHFQSDIESLQIERGELKDKLLSVTKRTFLENLVAGMPASQAQSPSHYSAQHTPVLASGTPTTGSPSGVTSEGMIEYTRHLQRQNWRLKSQNLVETLQKLPLIHRRKQLSEKAKQMEKELSDMKLECTSIICESYKIAFNSEITPARKEYLLHINNQRKTELAEKMADLKHKLTMAQAEQKSRNVSKGDFASFSTDRSQKNVENTVVKVGMIKFPGWEKSTDKPKRIILTEQQLNEIHRIMAPTS